MNSIKKQKGISIVSAIFIITVLAMMGAYMLKLSAVQHLSTGLSAQGIRAHFAAVSGLEWATWLATNTQVDHDSICGNPQMTTTFQLTSGTLAGFNITVTCNNHGGFQEASNNYEVDFITVEASKGVGNDYVYRKITATVTTGGVL
ncbi:MAG: hypothetical protein OEW89_08655 [Gammaproteobacteria bacterium]|nr:hypothetical protein [Gammaproteobacteria bacterium]